MAFLVFLKKGKKGASFCRLSESVVLGRSLDCDILVPDVFVSRRHCRVEPTPDGWAIVDLESCNGIYVGGQRVSRHVMEDGDVIEVGTIAIEFRLGSADAEGVSHSRIPFGPGTWVTELVDTIYADGMRPAAYTRQACRRNLWAAKASGADLVQLDDEDIEPPLLPGRFPDEWAEVDIAPAWTGLAAIMAGVINGSTTGPTFFIAMAMSSPRASWKRCRPTPWSRHPGNGAT